MPSEKIVLTFPRHVVRDPIVYRLVKDYDLRVNIIKASISPDEAGHMVMELDGTMDQLSKGHKYITSLNVICQPLSKDVVWREDRCTHCTACTSVCPTGALQVERTTMQVSFDGEKCIGCELCIPVCMYKAMQITF